MVSSVQKWILNGSKAIIGKDTSDNSYMSVELTTSGSMVSRANSPTTEEVPSHQKRWNSIQTYLTLMSHPEIEIISSFSVCTICLSEI